MRAPPSEKRDTPGQLASWEGLKKPRWLGHSCFFFFFFYFYFNLFYFNFFFFFFQTKSHDLCWICAESVRLSLRPLSFLSIDSLLFSLLLNMSWPWLLFFCQMSLPSPSVFQVWVSFFPCKRCGWNRKFMSWPLTQCWRRFFFPFLFHLSLPLDPMLLFFIRLVTFHLHFLIRWVLEVFIRTPDRDCFGYGQGARLT